MVFWKYWLNKILKLISPVSAFFNVVPEDFKLHMWLALLFHWTTLIRIPPFWLPPDYPRENYPLWLGLTRGQLKAAASSLSSHTMEIGGTWSKEPWTWAVRCLLLGLWFWAEWCRDRRIVWKPTLTWYLWQCVDQTALPLLMRVGWRIKHNVHYRSIAGGICRIRQRWHQAVWRES